MKTFVSVSIGLVAGIIIGIAASFKAAEKKVDKIIEKELEELAKERKAMRGDCYCHSTSKENTSDFAEVEDDSETPFENSEEEYENIAGQYEPAKKPYILEDKSDDFIENHPFLKDFSGISIVYDRDRGRVADEDGCEIFDVKGCLGWNNLQKLYSDDRFPRADNMHIVNERDGFIYICHAGDLYEYMNPEEDDRYDDED